MRGLVSPHNLAIGLFLFGLLSGIPSLLHEDVSQHNCIETPDRFFFAEAVHGLLSSAMLVALDVDEYHRHHRCSLYSSAQSLDWASSSRIVFSFWTGFHHDQYDDAFDRRFDVATGTVTSSAPTGFVPLLITTLGLMRVFMNHPSIGRNFPTFQEF